MRAHSREVMLDNEGIIHVKDLNKCHLISSLYGLLIVNFFLHFDATLRFSVIIVSKGISYFFPKKGGQFSMFWIDKGCKSFSHAARFCCPLFLRSQSRKSSV